MKLLNLVVIAGLSSWPLPLLADGPHEEIEAAPTAIFLSFDGAHSELAVTAMRREIEALVKPGGFRVQWQSLDDPRTGESFPDLMVAKFHGTCNMEGVPLLFSELGPYEDGAVLGSTHTSNGHVLPFSELYCDSIRRSIAPMAIGYSPEQREALLGRAMGRVLAHELFHVFTGASKHGRRGIAKTSYTRRDLVADGFAFDAKDVQRMGRAFSR